MISLYYVVESLVAVRCTMLVRGVQVRCSSPGTQVWTCISAATCLVHPEELVVVSLMVTT